MSYLLLMGARMGVNEERYRLACSDPECETNHPELNDPPPKFAVEVVVGCSRNANHAPIDEQIDSFQPQAFTCTWCGSKATEVAAKPPKWQQSHSRSTKGDE